MLQHFRERGLLQCLLSLGRHGDSGLHHLRGGFGQANGGVRLLQLHQCDLALFELALLLPAAKHHRMPIALTPVRPMRGFGIDLITHGRLEVVFEHLLQPSCSGAIFNPAPFNGNLGRLQRATTNGSPFIHDRQQQMHAMRRRILPGGRWIFRGAVNFAIRCLPLPPTTACVIRCHHAILEPCRRLNGAVQVSQQCLSLRHGARCQMDGNAIKGACFHKDSVIES